MGLRELEARNLVEALDVELARSLTRLAGTGDPDVALAIALTSRNVRRGHACFPIGSSPVEVWAREDGPAFPDADAWRDALAESKLTQDGPLVLDAAGRLYLRRYWQLEQDIAAEIAARSRVPAMVDGEPEWLQPSLRRFFAAEDAGPQRQAARNALGHRVSLLCGGPGTGKTTTVAAIVALVIEARFRQGERAPRTLLLAPTGKSAARLAEAVRRAKTRIDADDGILAHVPNEAQTVHRALGMRKTGLRYSRHADAPLEADFVVVDEASMIDLTAMRQLLDAVPREATLLIVGDPDQLTSVEAGSVLRDLVAANTRTWWKGRATELTTTYRYDEQRPLGRLVAAVRHGDAPGVEAALDAGDAEDVVWRPSESLAQELDHAAARWAQVLGVRDPATHFERRNDFAVLTPFRSGPVGTLQLGESIRDRLPDGVPMVEPIIIEQNSHELRVYNGDFGMRVRSEPPMAYVQSQDPGRFREIAAARLPRSSSAFALTVHKSQGSEFDDVLLLLPKEDAPLLTRELLYTAVSRARERVRIVGPKEVLLAALGRKARRDSGLVDAIERARP